MGHTNFLTIFNSNTTLSAGYLPLKVAVLQERYEGTIIWYFDMVLETNFNPYTPQLTKETIMSEKMKKAFRETKILSDQIVELEEQLHEQREKRKGCLHTAKSMIRSKDKYKSILRKMDHCFFCGKKAKETHHLLKVSDQAWNGIYIKENNLIPACEGCHKVCHGKDKHYFTKKPTAVPLLDCLFKQTIMWLATNMSATENSWEDKLMYHWKYEYLMGWTDIQQICFPYFARRQSEVYVLFAHDYQAKALIGKETKHKVHILINEGRLFELFEPLDRPFSPDHPIYDPNFRAEWITKKPTLNQLTEANHVPATIKR